MPCIITYLFNWVVVQILFLFRQCLHIYKFYLIFGQYCHQLVIILISNFHLIICSGKFASGDGVGACLHVVRDELELPVAFYSRQLRGAEKNYSVTELEFLAIVSAVRHFEYFLYGRSVTIYTDHRACVSLLSSKRISIDRIVSCSMLARVFISCFIVLAISLSTLSDVISEATTVVASDLKLWRVICFIAFLRLGVVTANIFGPDA